jgi:hypothetical protein
MKNVNWENVQDEIRRPVPGGYAAKITHVEDNEEKEYLKVEWEFAEGEFKGVNQETADTFGFWPMPFFCSYKEKALRFFKGFKTAVEMSNRNFVFKNDPQSLVGKFIGVVLGEEEYLSKEGNVKTRLYVAEKRSGKAIRDGDYTIPELKKLANSKSAAPSYSAPAANNFSVIDDDDADLPF